jgi:serine phosphatase RsbU (regulator of sigma subunit)
VGWSRLIPHALPAAVLALVVVLDVWAGPGQVVLGLVAISPLVAATVLPLRATVAYGVLALTVAALIGVYDEQYTAGNALAQAVRLIGVSLGGVVAAVACRMRLRREEEIARLSAVTATSAAAVKLAETLQLDLLGPPPSAGPWEFAVRYVPASRHAQVGGDWYDAFPTTDGGTVLVIGDVAGHGPPAAAGMAQVRGMLRTAAQVVAGSPAGALTVLDRTLATVGVPTLVTALVAVLHPHGGAGRDGPAALLCWSNAGHPPPVLRRADGTVQLLDRPPAMLLGVAAGGRREDHELFLHPGDTLLLYTDGLVERRTAPIDDGLAWLVETVRASGGRPLDDLCDGVLRSIGGRVDDDVALLAVRVPAGRSARAQRE